MMFQSAVLSGATASATSVSFVGPTGSSPNPIATPTVATSPSNSVLPVTFLSSENGGVGRPPTSGSSVLVPTSGSWPSPTPILEPTPSPFSSAPMVISQSLAIGTTLALTTSVSTGQASRLGFWLFPTPIPTPALSNHSSGRSEIFRWSDDGGAALPSLVSSDQAPITGFSPSKTTTPMPTPSQSNLEQPVTCQSLGTGPAMERPSSVSAARTPSSYWLKTTPTPTAPRSPLSTEPRETNSFL